VTPRARHRVAITYEAEAEEKTSETVIQKIFDELPCREQMKNENNPCS